MHLRKQAPSAFKAEFCLAGKTLYMAMSPEIDVASWQCLASIAKFLAKVVHQTLGLDGLELAAPEWETLC